MQRTTIRGSRLGHVACLAGLVALSVTPALVLSAGDSSTPLPPAYAESAFPEATRPAAKARLQGEAARAEARALWLDGRLDATFGALPPGAVARVRAEKRRLLRDRAVRFALRHLERGDATGLGFAEQALADAAAIDGMLSDEIAEWAVAPRAENRPVILDVRDYGARGDGVADDAPAFVRACAAVRALGGRPSVLRVPKGVYCLMSVQEARPICTPRGLSDSSGWVRRAYGLFEGLENCSIEGDGPTNTLLRAGFFGQQVALTNCRNTRFKGMELSMARLPYLEGEVEAWDAQSQTCVVRLDEGVLRPDDPSWTPTAEERRYGGESIGVAYGKDGRLLREAALLPWDRKTYTDLGGGRWRLPLDGRGAFARYVRNVRPGVKLVLPNRTNAYGAFSMKYCTGCAVEDVWVRASRSSAFLSVRSVRSSFVRCRVMPLPGRSLSSNADGCFADSGAFVYQCRFENMCDDGINVKTYASWADPGDRPDEISHTIPLTPGGGDVLSFLDPRTAQYLGNRTVAYGSSWVWTNGVGRFRTRFDGSVAGFRLGESLVHGSRLLGIGTYVGSCLFRNGRLTGCVVQTPCALVEDVAFENMQDAGVRVSALGDCMEGPPPYNVLVRNCRVDGCKTGLSAWLRMRDRAKKTWLEPAAAVMRDLEFVDNAVNHAAQAAYDFRNVGGLRLVGNRVDGRAVTVSDVRAAKVEGLSVEPACSGAKKAETLSRESFPVRDPFVLVDGGTYFLYASRPLSRGGRGVDVRTSSDLGKWSASQPVLTVPANVACAKVWAPEVHRYRGSYWMFVTLTVDARQPIRPMTQAGFAGGRLEARGVWVFRSDSPRGPFVPVKTGPVTPSGWMCLDGTLWVENGEPWMVFCHEWCQTGNGRMMAAPMSDDLSRFTAEPVELFRAADAPNGGHVTDGPFLRRTRDGVLRMIWSNFIEGSGYCVLQCASASGSVRGPWKGHVPLFTRDGGHGMIFSRTDGAQLLAIHQPNTSPDERMRLFPVRETAAGFVCEPGK